MHENLFSIIKIVEGAVRADPNKVVEYAKKLAADLDAQGQTEGARRILQAINGSKASQLALSRMGEFSASSLSVQAPVDRESSLGTADEQVFRRGAEPIFLDEQTSATVDRFLRLCREASGLLSSGVRFSPSMLIYGPPGCGKTHLARHIAAELGLPLVTSRADGLISSYLGSTSKNIRQLFEYAASKPCVLFLDEFDALAKRRDDAHEMGELKRVVIGLLQNIDALGQDHVLLAATNHEHLLDPAVWRRFFARVHLDLPARLQRAEIASQVLSSCGQGSLADVCAELTLGSSGSQVRALAENVCLFGYLNGGREPNGDELFSLLTELNPKIGPKTRTKAARARYLRRLNPHFFTQARIAQLFGTTQPTISKLLRQKG